jgi:hypothetical protein
MFSPSRMMSLGLPLLLGYLTWSTIDTGAGGLGMLTAPPASVQYRVRDGGAPLEVSSRDPFSQEVQEKVAGLLSGPASAVLGSAAVGDPTKKSKEDKDEMRLMGTAIMGKLRLAIIDGKRLREGDRYRGLWVAVIAAERVILTDAQGRNLILKLDVATSDEIELAVAALTPVSARKSNAPTAKPDPPPLHRGLAALTGSGGQKEILRMLGIPES